MTATFQRSYDLTQGHTAGNIWNCTSWAQRGLPRFQVPHQLTTRANAPVIKGHFHCGKDKGPLSLRGYVALPPCAPGDALPQGTQQPVRSGHSCGAAWTPGVGSAFHRPQLHPSSKQGLPEVSLQLSHPSQIFHKSAKVE